MMFMGGGNMRHTQLGYKMYIAMGFRSKNPFPFTFG